ncbi:MAG: hypothetical protein H6625_01295 [Bdellovibrionaceae bacterium]|nr:hypothetical protein [Pseudobdellovibrionaceae bacterium]
MNIKNLTKIAIASASLLVGINASANNAALAQSVVTRVGTIAVNIGAYSSATGALGAAITNTKEFREELVSSMDKHGGWAIGPVKQIEAALKVIAQDKSVKGMSKEEALEGIATMLQAISKLSDVNQISGVTGNTLNMKNKKTYFDGVNVVGLDNKQEEAVLAGVAALIQGGNLSSGLQGNKISLNATRKGIEVLKTFISENNLGDVQAALIAFERLVGEEGNAVDRAGKVAVACGI